MLDISEKQWKMIEQIMELVNINCFCIVIEIYIFSHNTKELCAKLQLADQ